MSATTRRRRRNLALVAGLVCMAALLAEAYPRQSQIRSSAPESSTRARRAPAAVTVQVPPEDARITPSGLDLPPGRLWDAAEDEFGYLWLASEAGLMFDGGAAQAMIMDTDADDNPAIGGATTSVAASESEGVWYADGTLNHLNPWTNEHVDTGIAADTVVDGPSGHKWTISGLEQVRLVDVEDATIVAETTIELDHAGRRTNPAASAKDGTLYVGGGSTIIEVSPAGTTRPFVVTSEVAAVTEGADGSVLYSTLSGLWRIGPDLRRPELLVELPQPSRGVLPTTALAQLDDGTVLVGLGGGGLGVFDPTTATWVDHGDEPLTDAVIDLIFEQSNGSVWLATDRGELLHYRYTTDFGALPLPTEHVPLALSMVDESLWAALGPDGVARYNATANQWTQPISFAEVIDVLDEIPTVTDLTKFRDDLWIATANEGLLKVENGQTSAELMQGLTNQTADLQVDGDRLYAVSAQQTQILGLDEEGRLAWDLNWVTPQNRGKPAIATISNGVVYVVSHAGLGIFDASDPSDLPTQRFDDRHWAPWANAIYLHDDEIAWIGTEIGLVRLDLATGRTKHFSSLDGLPSNTVTTLHPSADQTALWVGTNNGVSLLDLSTETVLSNFGSADGLPDDSIRPVRSVAGPDGTGYVLTSEGIGVLPAEVPKRSPASQSFAVICRSGCGERPAVDMMRNPNRLTVDLVSPEGGNARLMPLEYRLDAPDGEWEFLPAGVRTVSFGSLTPGTHRLEVRPANVAPDDQHDWTVLTVQVDQIWWRRGPVQILILFGALLVGALFLTWRDSRRRAQRLELEQTIAERTRELEHSRADAERANQAKNRFLMTVSHDLRSPLSGIVGFTELIAGTSLDDRQRRYNDGVARSAKHLAELVEDLLYQSANATLATDEPTEREATLIETVIREAVEFVSAGATAHEITVTTSCQGCEDPILVDARGLKYVLGNLIANAINYSGGTSVHLEAIKRSDPSTTPDTEALYEFNLVDDGGNLDPDDAARVFEPGFRGPSVEVSGTGLGLSICQDWVAARGGEITVEVQPEIFTRFSFTLRLETASDGLVDHPQEIANGTPARNGRGERRPNDQRIVMVVEDDELVRDVLVTMLDGIGCDVSAFPTAELALGSLDGRKWDLIFTDVMMQPTSGIEFARAVRLQLGQFSPPVAAITGVPDEASQADIFDAILNKPVVAQDLQQLIDRF